MKIEKINDNQIRCILNKHDLASREIKLSELAYGTEKAKNLFRDMMQQASFEYGFEADDHPLMIEAIPLSSESIILNISKVEDPDELDTRFSKFSPFSDEADDYNDFDDEYDDSADEAVDYYSDDAMPDSEGNLRNDFLSLRDLLSNKLAGKNSTKTDAGNDALDEAEHGSARIYRFQDFAVLERLSVVLKDVYFGSNTLYKDSVNSAYYLVVKKSGHSPEEFSHICNILTEYGIRENTSPSREAYFMEHFTPMIKENALQVLAEI